MSSECAVCGGEFPLRQDGMVRKHGSCDGGGQPPRPPKGDADRPPDVVYLVRPGERNEELRYSLRSLRNLPEYGRVVIVGHKPSWVREVVHIPTTQTKGDKRANVRRNFEAIATAEDISGRFLLMNDDFHIIKPVDEVKPLHLGPLPSYIHRTRPTGYGKGLREALEALRRLGYESPDAYTAHVPLPMTKVDLAAALDAYDGLYGMATVVGALAGWRGKKTKNAKNPPPDEWVDRTYLSTSDRLFRYGDIGAFVRRWFAKPSPYETSV